MPSRPLRHGAKKFTSTRSTARPAILRQQIVDERTGKVVDKNDKARGYEITKGKYVEIEPEDLDAVEIEAPHVIDI